MRRGLLLMLLIALCAAPAARAASERHNGPVPKVKLATAAGSDSIGQYGYKTTGNNLLNLTFTNSGGWGVGYTSSVVPNFTYPTGSSLEHMVRGGLWIGATAPCLSCSTGTHPVVSFAAQDENGAVSTPLTEFTPLPNDVNTRLIERSILKNNAHYNPAAISEDDFIAQFRDVPGQQVDQEAHVPLMVQVTESIYSWSFSFAESFVIQHFVIKNVSSSDLLQNVYVTHYTEMQTLNKAAYSGYPSLTGGPTPYRHKLIHYFPDQRLITEQYCSGLDDCHYDRAPYTVGVLMLGTHPDTIINYNPHVLTRDYGGAALDAGTPYARDNDANKYNFQHLSQGRGEIDSLQVPGSSDPSQWLTVGPIPILGPGDSVSVDYAFVGGTDTTDVKANAAKAQLAFDLNYNLPRPPDSPRLYARPTEQGIELLWEGSPDTTFDKTSPAGQERDFEGYKIYLGTSLPTLKLIGQFDIKDTTGFNTGLDSLRFPADQPPVVFQFTDALGNTQPDTMKYHYVIRGLRDGFKYYMAVTSYDTGNQRVAPMESGKTQNSMEAIPGPSQAQASGKGVVVFPNPYRVEARWDYGAFAQDHFLWFANLPAKCRIRIYTLGGDLVQDVNYDAATYHGVDARGVYSAGRDFGIDPPTLSGSMWAWNLITRFNQAVASGLYLYSVEDPAGKRQVGKFVVIKSDIQQ